jgi:nucleoid-associated protein YgaU
VVLIVDEAQNLDEHSMESLRLLSNLETRKHKLIQIILSGQPELDTKLSQPELRQLAQRISMRRYIIPLSETETYDYIQHRLTIAHYNGSSIFDRKALRLIWEYSGGVPRKINILCDNAFLIGYGLRKKRIRASEVEEAIKDLSWSPFSQTIETQTELPLGEYLPQLETKSNHRRVALIASLVFLAILVMIVGLNFQDSLGKLREWGTHVYSTLLQGSSLTESSSSKETLPRSAVKEQSSGTQESIGPPGETTKEASPLSSVAALDKFVQKQAADVNRAITSTTDQTEHSGPSRMRHEHIFSNVSEEKNVPETEVGSGQTREPEKIATLWAGIRKRKSPLTDGTGANERDEVIAIVRRSVVVESGDTLSSIISRVYGTYDEQILSAVLSENPEINSPHEIFVGQTIKLPVSLNFP